MTDKSLFVAKAEEIAAEEPSYRSGGTGTDGTCDCIGLVIGAIRRAGGSWTGLKGSNYAARCEMVDLLEIVSNSDLSIGEVVYKSREPGAKGYNLKERYLPGGSYFNGDLRDYYHIGIVESIYPLRIRHMTTPKPKMDTELGAWKWHGKLKKIDYSGESGGGGGGDHAVKVTISGGNPNEPIRLRASSTTKSKILKEIPQGSEADLIREDGKWDKVTYAGTTGYVMAIYVHKEGKDPEPDPDPSGDTVTVPKDELQKIYDQLGDWLGLRG